jgi:hypothetical protein
MRRHPALAAVFALAMACGGRTVLGPSGDACAGGSDTGSGSGTTSSSASTATACVDISITPSDQACSSNEDCQFAVSGVETLVDAAHAVGMVHG